MKVLAALILASCGSVAPHYYEVSGGYGEGQFNRGITEFDEYSAMVTLGWYGDRYFRDVGKSNAYWSRFTGPLDDLGEVPGRIQQDEIGGPSEAALFSGLVPEAPKTKEEGIALAWWGLAVLLLAVSVFVVAKARHLFKRNGASA